MRLLGTDVKAIFGMVSALVIRRCSMVRSYMFVDGNDVDMSMSSGCLCPYIASNPIQSQAHSSYALWDQIGSLRH